MNQIQVTGTQKIGEHEFTGIEGGFGQEKKAMLVKDIAEIHGQPVSEINRRINDNIVRFKNEIDIIDFLNGSEPLREMARQNGWIGSNRTQNVYLLSERGYFKLLKILEDDKAWDIYDELVDGYFDMRETIKQQPQVPTTQRGLVQLALSANEETNQRIDVIESDLKEIKDNKLITSEDRGTIDSHVKKRVSNICRDRHLNQEGRSMLFQDLGSSIKQLFNVPNRGRIKDKDFIKALDFVDTWEPSSVTKAKINQLNLFEDVA